MKPQQLRNLYGTPTGRVSKKVLPKLEQHSRHFIAKSPMAIISTFDTEGKVDTSPRGGEPGFVHVLDDNCILIPDSKGNNRVDSLINIASTGRIGMLFLMPGIDETLRINGAANVTAEQEYLGLFPSVQRPPKSCIVVHIEEVFLHCAKALMRSELWNPAKYVARADFPTISRILKDQLGGNEAVESHEDMVKRYKADL